MFHAILSEHFAPCVLRHWEVLLVEVNMSTRPILLFKDIASKLTGFSTPLFGVSWQPPETERKIAISIVTFLEDRRVLYNPTELEIPHHCISSVVEIRHFLTEVLADLDQKSELANNVRTMRAACRKFLDAAQGLERDHLLSFSRSNYSSWEFYGSLGEMRGIFGICLSHILLAYKLDIEEELATILPYKD
jgi:hypothetical protein